ncbi:hypothetical protein AA983_10565 [Dermacoccus sp. PE3]|uniref:hypothetical protein n=1 Tax=Dermacoccus sp. PE3 TaxID=1641401 RepID=UPI000641E8D0|nr:hypothetical protein [Dermacoccus sp. PE3]KLO62087.1 hypothetical protein AA983_10565 [Dermacoccus sp. PE3]
MRRLAVLTSCSMLALAGCASTNHRYDSATELRSAAVNSGLHCTGYVPSTPPEGAASAGACVGGTKATFIVYTKDEDAKKGIATARAAVRSDEAVLHGPNWYLVTSSKQASDLEDAVGGDVSTK